MEREFDMTNFEEALRNQADQFKMIPSRRVWHGIYNDLHPGSRWPSIAMGLVFLFTLLGIGHLNNTTKRLADVNSASEKNESGVNSEKQIADVNSSKSNLQGINFQKQPEDKNGNSISGNVTSVSNLDEKLNAIQNNKARVIKLYPNGINSTKANKVEKENLILNNSSANNRIDKNNSGTTIINSGENNLDDKNLQQQKIFLINNTEVELNTDDPVIITSDISKNTGLNSSLNKEKIDNLPGIFFVKTDHVIPVNLDKNSLALDIQLDNNISEIKENQSIHKKPIHTRKKRNEKITWLYYVTPTVSTVSFTGKGLQLPANSSLSPIIVQSNQSTNGMIYNARLGYMVGTQMSYAFSKEWQFVAGANFSNSGYHVISNQVHPTFATLMLKDETTGMAYSHSYITHYGNGQGQNQISLSNYSLQFSLPVGMQYALFENSKIKINLASTIEPSLILKSNAFIISSDGRYYVNDPNLIRKLNLSGNLGSFITFKSNKINWLVGPSIRYQLLSTYQKNYPIKEHLIDYGIRIGISK